MRNGGETERAVRETSSDEAAFRKTSSDEAAVRKTSFDEAAFREAAPDEAAFRETVSDEAAFRETASDEAAIRETASDEAAFRKTSSDEAVVRKASSDEAAFRKTSSDEAAVRETSSDEAAIGETADSETVTDKLGTSGTVAGKMARSIWYLLDSAFGLIDVAVYVCMIGVVLLQIFARVFLPKVPAWTEELSRYLQVYLVAFGAALAVKYDAFVSVETVLHMLGQKAGILLRAFDNTVALVMFAFFFRYSMDLYKLGMPRSAVTMPGITMNVIYFSMMLMSGSTLFYLGRKVFLLVQEYRREEGIQ